MRTRGILLAAGVLGGALPVLASQPTTVPPTYDEAIVVTGSLEELLEEDASSSVTVIGRDEIEQRQATSVQELLRTVPGVTVVRSGSPGKATSVFTRGTESDHTLVLWNGVEINDPFFGGFDWAFLPTDGVERVEVLRGPASALYGSDAIGGVIQVFTGAGRETSVRLEGGSDDYLRGALAAGGRAGPVRLEVTGHLRRGEGRAENDFFDGEEVAVRADWSPTETTAIGLVARAGDAEIGVPFDFTGAPSPRRRQERATRQIALPVTWEAGAWKVDAQLSRTETELLFIAPDDPFSGGDTDAGRDGGRVVASYRFRDGLWAAAGADWQREEVASLSDAGSDLEDASRETWSTFGQVFWDAGPVALDIGVRRDDDETFGSETTLRAAAVVPLDAVLGAAFEGTRLRASYGEGFRAPSLGDLFFPGFGNPALQPETSETAELGLDWRAGSWSVDLVGFSTEIDDLIVFDFARSLPRNIGRARIRGLELSAGRALRSRTGLNARLAATYQEPEDATTGEQLLRRPETSASLLLGWSPVPAVDLSASVEYVGERPDFGVTLDDYTTVQAAAAWQWREWIEPYARVENVLDEEYREAAGFPALGRRWIGGLHLSF